MSHTDTTTTETKSEFFRLFKILKDHLVEEGLDISDMEIGHLAVICDQELQKAREERSEEILKTYEKFCYEYNVPREVAFILMVDSLSHQSKEH